MTLQWYIRQLVEALRECDPEGYDRMCRVVGRRTARIQLDDETAFVWMNLGVVQVEPALGENEEVFGEGKTDSQTVLALLDGSLEVSDAILNDALVVHGEIEQVNRMFQAIEILLDASPRCPRLQNLSRQFVTERSAAGVLSEAPQFRGSEWYPFAVPPDEKKLLIRYDLLPESTDKH